MTIGEMIKEAREAIGMSRHKLAVRAGVSGRAARRWENGRFVPNAAHLKTLSIILNSEALRQALQERLAQQKPRLPRRRPWSELAGKITEARLRAGLTRAQLGEKVGFQGKLVGNWERGENAPRRETLERVAEVLNAPHLLDYGRRHVTQPKRDELAKAIQRARHAAGISQRETAKRLRVSPTSVVLWENGRVSIKEANLRKLAKLLNAPDLLNLDGPAAQPSSENSPEK